MTSTGKTWSKNLKLDNLYHINILPYYQEKNYVINKTILINTLDMTGKK